MRPRLLGSPRRTASISLSVILPTAPARPVRCGTPEWHTGIAPLGLLSPVALLVLALATREPRCRPSFPTITA